ncbi:MAG: chemotaxis protein CheA [Sphingomonadaceae bacterium]|nr:chemotaxis protein CheA [Sphingomonadaceae bacterium]MCP5390917.1 chemotaxis protein CheA [Sphingomonadaceae bacterium]MCP5394673.1 chemotaxis protein CheA [Sphingomonadaceae bacterium]
MDDLLADFVAESREMLEAIGGEIVAWEAEPGDRARLDAIFRFVHTVKGNCGFFDFPRLEKLSHAAEGALAEVRAERRTPDSRLVNAVLAIIDRITLMVDAIEAGEELPEGGDDFLIAALEPDTSDTGETVAMQAATTQARSTGGNNAAPRTIRLPVELLDRVMSGVSDMVLARNDLARRLREAGAEPTLDGPFERLNGILNDVREAVTKMRMQRIEMLYNALPRLVRDLSAELGKQVMIDLDGGDVELDREMIEMMRDPMTHIIRNAIDHGIESPADRLQSGKREIGLLSISARQSGNRITITVSDDGAGLDCAKIGQKAVAAGLLSDTELAAMPDDQVFELIFEPGLSTAEEVSSVSGRGVGMDVVRANIERVGGSITVTSNKGEGTQFHLQIPLTLSIISALTVSAGGQRFAIPQSYVEEIVHGGARAIEFSQVGETRLMTFRERRTPCISLAHALGLGANEVGQKQKLVLLRLGPSQLFAVAVDTIHDQEDLVVKPLAPAVMQTGIYAGTTLLDDGHPVLMLDVPTLAQRNGLNAEARTRATVPNANGNKSEADKTRKVMTFTGFDGRRKAIGMELVVRIDQVAAEAVDRSESGDKVVVGDTIYTLLGLEPGCKLGETVRLLRLSDSQSELSYAVAELEESVDLVEAIKPTPEEPGLEGVVLHGGQPLRVIDGFALFARHACQPVQLDRPSCRIPGDDDWASRMLQPLIQAAGYRIAGEDEEGADIVIAMDSHAETAASDAAACIRLYSDPDEAARKGDGVYRYDRTGLVDALRRARQEKVA